MMAIVLEGKICFISFIIGAISSVATSLCSNILNISIILLLVVYAAATNISVYLVYGRKKDYDVSFMQKLKNQNGAPTRTNSKVCTSLVLTRPSPKPE